MQMAVCSLYALVKNAQDKSAPMAKLYAYYKTVCQGAHLSPLSSSDFKTICGNLSDNGVLVMGAASKKTTSRDASAHVVSLGPEEREVESAFKDKQVLATLLQRVLA